MKPSSVAYFSSAKMRPTAASMAQDLPPAEGYEPVQYKVPIPSPQIRKMGELSANQPQRNLPIRGFRPSYYLAAVAVIMTYGFYKYGKGVREHKCAIVLPWVPGAELSRSQLDRAEGARADMQLKTASSHVKRCGREYI
ncbi:MAG: hypothetical protein L6R39_001817 [Caloplaca ligustica]|nr:MAG: hypothetical protein L6R39_001817 [Caloplaca ligustica]